MTQLPSDNDILTIDSLIVPESGMLNGWGFLDVSTRRDADALAELLRQAQERVKYLELLGAASRYQQAWQLAGRPEEYWKVQVREPNPNLPAIGWEVSKSIPGLGVTDAVRVVQHYANYLQRRKELEAKWAKQKEVRENE